MALGCALVAALLGPAAVAECAKLPPAVPDRVGRAQLQVTKIADKTRIQGLIDIIWTDYFYKPGWAKTPGIYSIKYMTAARDPNPNAAAGPDPNSDHASRDLGWYLRNRPDWIVYKCPGEPPPSLCRHGLLPDSPATPAFDCFFSNSVDYVPLDTSNPDVREFLFDANLGGPPSAPPFPAYLSPRGPVRIFSNLLASGLYDAVGVDNLGAHNNFGRCGIYRQGAFLGKFSGKPVDPLFISEQIEWLSWLRRRVNAAGGCLAGNDYFESGDPAGFLQLADSLDIVLDEHGFTRNNKPMETGAAWRTRIDTYLRLTASGKPLIIVDYLPRGEEATLATRYAAGAAWSLANYLLIKGDRTYLALTTEGDIGQEGITRLVPPAFAETGRALEPVRTDSRLHWRRFEHALAIVNPTAEPGWFDLGPTRWRGYDGAALSGLIDVAAGTALVLVPDT